MKSSVVKRSWNGEKGRELFEGWPFYVRRTKAGRPVFIIEKQISVADESGAVTTHRFHVSTRCTKLDAALKQLARFEADPFSYNPVGGDLRAPLLLTAEYTVKFFEMQQARGLSLKYARETNTLLLKWVVALRGKDLRRLTVPRDILPVLDAAGGNRRPMMAALKTFCTWLRVERHEMTSAEDVTRDLRLPQADMAKRKRKVAHDIGDVRKVLAKLSGVYRDALLFQWATSCHVTELERFVRDERSRLIEFSKPKRLADGTMTVGLAEFWHKSTMKTGKLHQVALTRPEHVEAARRLRERGSVPKRSDLLAAIYEACDAAKVPRMSYVMRHTTLTRAAKRGISEERRMQHANHQNAETARRYVDVELPLAAIPAEKL
jgi:hypothetical protein